MPWDSMSRIEYLLKHSGEDRVKITKKQLKRIIKEAIDPRAASVDTSMFMSPAEVGLGPDTDYDDSGPTFTMVADMLGRSGPDDILFLDEHK